MESDGMRWPRLIQGVLLGGLAYWVLLYVLLPAASSARSYGWRLLFLSMVVAGAGSLLAIRKTYLWLGIGLILAAAARLNVWIL